MHLDEHLFRRESGRMVAALTRVFGVRNIALAEDVVQEAFCRAIETWGSKGVPENPSAWLMKTAKNKALDILRRQRTARTYEPELSWLLESEWTRAPVVEEIFDPGAVRDEMLRMMFSCCHPRLSEEAQVGLILNLLCGFSVDEIAAAFVSSHAAVEKRLVRGKKTLASSKRLFEPDQGRATAARLPAVQRALYLLFNEGYHGACPERAVRQELCREAMRLTALLLQHPLGRTPCTYALAALMCLHGARLPARLDGNGNLIVLAAQNRALWDGELIDEGLKLLEFSATGRKLTEYHVEAAIASFHARAGRFDLTDWASIIALYDRLMVLRPSPIVALNRAIAIGQRDGPARGLHEIEQIKDHERLVGYPFYFAAVGEMELWLGRLEAARTSFARAKLVARNGVERRLLEQRLRACQRSDAESRFEQFWDEAIASFRAYVESEPN